MTSLSSSKKMYQLNEQAQPPCQCPQLQTSEMGDIHVYFIRAVAPGPRTESSELHNLHKNLAASLPKKFYNMNGPTLWYGWHGFKQHIVNNITDEWCKRL